MKIRKMTAKDIPAVIKIESESYENAISESELFSEIRNKSNGTESPILAPIVTCDDLGDVVGYAMFDRADEAKSVLTLLVISTAKSNRREGVASGMVGYIKKKMKTLKCESITARVHQDRIPAQNFLAKSGFDCSGIDVTEVNEKECEIYNFNYSVPMDDLSARHIAKIAKQCREARAAKEE
jgi:L-amino acid N-acyltransferase YncA|tara:strand:- start:8065 stop:8610 length:546 start_codon:yes stop_codon:yes gene_type:complete